MKTSDTHTHESSNRFNSSKVNGHGLSVPSVPVLQQKENSEEPVQEFSAIQQKSEKQSASGADDTRQLKPNNTGLPDNLKSGVENLSGMSLDHVKVHYNSSQPAQLNALAYAQGSDIHVGPGQEKHLPHEAWHVVQQAQGRVQATKQMKTGVAVNDDPGLEHEADVMGEKAMNVGVSTFPAQFQCKNSYGSNLLQGRFFPPLDAEKTRWNAILDHVTLLDNNHGLGNIADINAFIALSEGNWDGDDDHAAPAVRFNAFVTLISKIKDGLESHRVDRGDANNLDWDDITDFLDNNIGNAGFLVIAHAHGALGGGHGNGVTWTAHDALVLVQRGTIPDAAHGRGDGARNGARADVRTVVDAHNAKIDAAKVVVDGL